MPKSERSYIAATEVRVEHDGDKKFISGYASVFNKPTDKVGFREVVMPGAFDRALKAKQDVRALINHDPNKLLGRTKSGTLNVSSDDKGLKFRVEMPDTTYANDLMEMCKRGDMNECSFGFRAVKQAWVQEPDDEDKTRMVATRQLHDLDLGDVSVVTYPAYDGTSAKVGRSYSQAEIRTFFPEGIPDDVCEHVSIIVEDRAVKYLVNAGGETHLPYTDANGKPDHRLMGAAWAALHGGYRGNKYAGPNKSDAIAKLTSVYKSEGMDTPSESNADAFEQEQRARELALMKAGF
jgi:HK97 family phage prohead protease